MLCVGGRGHPESCVRRKRIRREGRVLSSLLGNYPNHSSSQLTHAEHATSSSVCVGACFNKKGGGQLERVPAKDDIAWPSLLILFRRL